jgi:hypothetical protein
MGGNESDLGEQALSKAVEVGLSAQLDEVETLEAEVHTDPIALMQGEIKSADIHGHGLVMEGDLRTEDITVKTDGIAIDPLKAAFGDIKLTRPTNAAALVTLTESDIERAFNSDFICQKLQNLEVMIDDRPMHVNAQRIQFSLPSLGKVAIATDITVLETEETQHLSLSAVPEIGSQGHQVVLKDLQVESGDAPKALTDSLLQAASELLDLRNFALDGMSLQLQKIDVKTGQIVLQAKAHLEKFPGS